MCDNCGCAVQVPGHGTTKTEKIEVLTNILDRNSRQAEENRAHFSSHGIFAINLMSSPGSGKTTLLEKTIDLLKGKVRIGVIEGDLETSRDADRIKAKGVPAYQVTTGQSCHLDAAWVHEGLHHLPLDRLDIVFVENVGNLVCPAVYDLGTNLNVVLLSVTEGDDKPAKYPVMFRRADWMLITKTDLIPHLDFNPQLAIEEARKINPKIQVAMISSKTGDGLADWVQIFPLLIKEGMKGR